MRRSGRIEGRVLWSHSAGILQEAEVDGGLETGRRGEEEAKKRGWVYNTYTKMTHSLYVLLITIVMFK